LLNSCTNVGVGGRAPRTRLFARANQFKLRVEYVLDIYGSYIYVLWQVLCITSITKLTPGTAEVVVLLYSWIGVYPVCDIVQSFVFG
jgi:hypothetical protein